MVTLNFTRNEFPHVISGRRASETHNFAIGGCGGGNYSVQVDAKSMECLGGGEGALRSPPASRKSLCSVSGTGSVSPRNREAIQCRHEILIQGVKFHNSTESGISLDSRFCHELS